MIYFTTGFYTMARIFLLAAGGAAAVCAAALILLILLSFTGWVFDNVTEAMARRWKKRGKRPRGKLAGIIMEHQDDG